MRRFAFGLLVLAAAAGLGCKANITPIKTLLDDPARFDKQTVRIAGTVQEAVGILGYGAYRVSDGTGVLLVATQENGAPRTGAQVGVEGEFRAAFTLGTETGAVLMEKQRFTP